MRFKQLFSNVKIPVIGMIHVQALPGTPFYKFPFRKIIEKACHEAEIYESLRVDGIIVENMHDIPYVQEKQLGPETVSFMTKICSEVQKIVANIPCGVQILACGNREAIAVAKATNFQFIRCEGFVFGHIADEGYTNACAGSLLRYRKSIHADDVLILADIKKKHSSHAITEDVDIVETAKAAEFFATDGVIITGQSTGDPADQDELKKLKKSLQVPVIIGSGVTKNNVEKYIEADGLIIGSEFKKDGNWKNDLCIDRIESFMENMREMRKKLE